MFAYTIRELMYNSFIDIGNSIFLNMILVITTKLMIIVKILKYLNILFKNNVLNRSIAKWTVWQRCT